MKVVFDYEIDDSADRVLEAYKNVDFHVAKQKDLGAISSEILSSEEKSDGKVCFKMKVSEPSRVPAFLHKSDVDTYVIESEVDPQTRTMTWKVTPEVMEKVFFLKGEVYMGASGDGAKIEYTTELEVKVPLVGKKAEKMGLAQTEEECKKQTEFLKTWLKDN